MRWKIVFISDTVSWGWGGLYQLAIVFVLLLTIVII